MTAQELEWKLQDLRKYALAHKETPSYEWEAESVAWLLSMIDAQAAEIDQLKHEIRRLRTALDKSVKLQSHYAKLLNMYDEGERIQFKDAEEWLKRLDTALATEDKR